MQNEDVFLSETEVAELGLFAVKTLQNRRSLGLPPRFYKVGRIVRYKKSDVLAWLEELAVAPRIEP